MEDITDWAKKEGEKVAVQPIEKTTVAYEEVYPFGKVDIARRIGIKNEAYLYFDRQPGHLSSPRRSVRPKRRRQSG